METNLHYEYGNIEALQEAKLRIETTSSGMTSQMFIPNLLNNIEPSLISYIEPHKNDYHTSLMILSLTLSIACALALTVYNPFATAGLAEVITEIVAFKPF